MSVEEVDDAVVDSVVVERTGSDDRFFTRGHATLDAGSARGVLEAFVTVSSAAEGRFLIDGADHPEGRATDGSSFAFVPESGGRQVLLEVGAGRCIKVSAGAFARLMARWEAALEN